MESNPLSKKEIRYRNKCELSYEAIASKLSLTPSMTVNEQVWKMVLDADEVLTNICTLADLIKIDYLAEAQELVNITKGTWTEFVRLATESANGTVTDKKLEKLNESFIHNTFTTSQRMKFIETYIANQGGAVLELPDADQDIPLPELEEFTSNEEFELLLHKAVNTRNEINQLLWPTFYQISEAFEYITNYKHDKNNFKEIVDMYHYRYGGYPSESTPPKLWSIINRFTHITKLLQEFEIPLIEKELKRFGITVSFTDINQNIHKSFGEHIEYFLDADIYNISNDIKVSEMYPELSLDAYILSYQDKQIAFAPDTREIYQIAIDIPLEYLKITNNDTFELLEIPDTEIEEEFGNWLNDNFYMFTNQESWG